MNRRQRLRASFLRGAMLAVLTTSALVVGAAIAHGAAPPEGSEDYEIMHPFADWIRTRYGANGSWCCSVADGRPVKVRYRDGHTEAFATKEKFGPMAPDDWVVIPDDAFVVDRVTGQREENPTGVAILWINPYLPSFKVWCFIDAAGG